MTDWTNIGLLPVADGGLTKTFNINTHRGLDFGWIDTPYCSIMAWQDGVVVQAENASTGGDRGEYCVLEHTYNDGTKRWSAYLHLVKGSLKVKQGDSVKMGDCLGYRGNTGLSNGIHLHLYLSDKVDSKTAYTYTMMKNNCLTNPYQWLYVNTTYNTKVGQSLSDLSKMPQRITYPQPVSRDETKHQVEIEHKNKWLRLRATPNGEIYDQWCTNGIYNVLETQWNGSYLWYHIDTIDDHQFWVAFSENWATDLPEISDYKQMYEQAIAQVTLLEAEAKRLRNEKDEINEQLASAENKITEVKDIVNK